MATNLNTQNLPPILVDSIPETNWGGDHIRIAMKANDHTGDGTEVVANLVLTDHSALAISKVLRRAIFEREARRSNIVNFPEGGQNVGTA